MKKLTIALAAIAILNIAACGKEEKVGFATLETARNQSKENAEVSAAVYRSANPQFANYMIVTQTDSTMMPECPQGDGWASAKLIDRADPSKVVPLKCSTVSGSVGCLSDADFKTKSYAADDGHCQPTDKVPFPLPKLSK